ncbi:MAG: DEAD/DEAH box helicase family protein [Myxococcota bacterium]|jgi:hypothetical protein|nr:DEAD/DEAH box helicase family protein [Myxococcota bacterium]
MAGLREAFFTALQWAATAGPRSLGFLAALASLVGGSLLLSWLLVRTRPRQAAGPAYLLISLVFSAAYPIVWGVDRLLSAWFASPAGSLLEDLVFGRLLGLSALLPLAQDPRLALLAHASLLVPLYLLLVLLCWWLVLGGPHLDAADREQAEGWLWPLSGRRTPHAVEPSFSLWCRPLLLLLGGLLGLALARKLLGAPTPPASLLVVGGLLGLGGLVNLVSRGKPPAPAPAAPTPLVAAAPAPPRPRPAELLTKLTAAGFELWPLDGTPTPAAVASHDPAPWLGAERLFAQVAAGLIPGAGPYLFQSEAIRRPPGERALLLSGPAGAGKTTALLLTACDGVLRGLGCSLLVTVDRTEAEQVAARVRAALAQAEVPALFQVACQPAELARLRDVGHAPQLVVLPVASFLDELLAAGGDGELFDSLGTVLVDDLQRLDAEAASTLRVGLARLRLLTTSPAGAAPGWRLLAASQPVGSGQASWASTLLGMPTELRDTAGAPLPATSAFLVTPPAATPVGDAPGAILRLVAELGLSGAAHDDLHLAGPGSPCFGPWPLLPLPAPATPPGPCPEVTLVVGRAADLPWAFLRHRPVGPPAALPEGGLVLLFPADGLPLGPLTWRPLPLSACGEEAEGPIPWRSAVPLVETGRVRRQGLLAALAREVDEDLLLQSFPAAELAELRLLSAAGPRLLGERRAPRLVWRDGREEIDPAHCWLTLLTRPSPRQAPGWVPATTLPLLRGADSLLLAALDPAEARSRCVPGTTFVRQDEQLRVLSLPAAAGPPSSYRADPVREPGGVRRTTELAVRPRSLLVQPTAVRFGLGGPLVSLELQEVEVVETIRGWESLDRDWRAGARGSFAVAIANGYPTQGVRVLLTAAVAPVAGAAAPAAAAPPPVAESVLLALELATRLALSVATTLPDEVLEVCAEPGAAGGAGIWILDRTPGGHGAARWLSERLLGRPGFWQLLLTVLAQPEPPGWPVLRTDARETRPDFGAARDFVRQATGLPGIGED